MSSSHQVIDGTTFHDFVFSTKSLGITLETSVELGLVITGVSYEGYRNKMFPGEAVVLINNIQLCNVIKKRNVIALLSSLSRPLLRLRRKGTNMRKQQQQRQRRNLMIAIFVVTTSKITKVFSIISKNKSVYVKKPRSKRRLLWPKPIVIFVVTTSKVFSIISKNKSVYIKIRRPKPKLLHRKGSTTGN